MTQEELDALMNEEIDLDELPDESTDESVSSATLSSDAVEIEDEISESIIDEKSTRDDSHHLPPPATDEHKMVHQLDDVTKESEEKATEIFDIIEGISTQLMDREERVEDIITIIQSNIDLFTTLSEKFPDVEAFQTQLAKNKEALENSEEGLEVVRSSGDAIMNVMDIMQYQDIHRQKIERVINVMRALSKYMNNLFEGKVDDEKRASSASHIPGDSTEDLASTDDIEALLAQFGNK